MRAPRASVATVLAVATLAALAGCAGAPASGPNLPADWPTDMLNQVNAQRAAAGVAPLAPCAALDRSAQTQSAGQAAMGRMSHAGADGSTLQTRVARAGYGGWTALAENVGEGYTSVNAVVVAWMGDAVHRDNLLSPAYAHLGLGVASDAHGVEYWTQDFGRDGRC